MSSWIDTKIGEVLEEHGFLDAEEYQECLELRDEFARSGIKTSVLQVMLENAYISKPQADLIKDRIRRMMTTCVGCQARIAAPKPGKWIRCPKCGSEFKHKAAKPPADNGYVPTIQVDRETRQQPGGEDDFVPTIAVDRPSREKEEQPLEDDFVPTIVVDRPQEIDDPAPAPRRAAQPSAPRSHEQLIGKELGGVRIESLLGRGAMGLVFRGTQTNLNRPVALKLLSLAAEQDESASARFIREAQSAATLNHPNIVQVYDVGEADGMLYFTMEFIDGQDALSLLNSKGVLTYKKVVEIGAAVARALAHARQRDIVHRDIKPENILISNEGFIKLADMGLAKEMSGAGTSGITAEGTAMGTPYYMAPEQIEDARFADHRSDIYSLGATLYHLATGERPFTGRTAMEIMQRVHTSRPAPVRKLNPKIPGPLAAVIEEMMSKDPADRPRKAAAVVEMLESATTGGGRREAPAKGARRGATGARRRKTRGRNSRRFRR